MEHKSTKMLRIYSHWNNLQDIIAIITISKYNAQSLVFGVVFSRSLFILTLCSFSFGHCIVYPSSIFGFWLSLWYLQTFRSFYKLVIKRRYQIKCVRLISVITFIGHAQNLKIGKPNNWQVLMKTSLVFSMFWQEG
jgi:hypothetical protein